jgi:putative transposon-encoded protein
MKRVPIIPETEIRINNIRGFYIRKVTRFGTSAKVDCPKEHLGKTVYLVILNHDDE